MPFKVKKPNKYGAEKTIIDGIIFDSKKEARIYTQFKYQEKSGLIRDLTLQPKFPLKVNDRQVKIKSEGFPNGKSVAYYADFSYIDCKTGITHYVDAKGFDTYVSRLKRAIVEATYNITIEII